VSTSDTAAAAEHWDRHRPPSRNLPVRQHGAALCHLPSGYREVNLALDAGALLAATTAAWLHQLTATG
jgi:hypothetical protein